MILLITQLLSFLVLLLYLKWKHADWYFYRAASVAMGMMYLMAAVGHIIYNEGMQLYFPEWVPFKKGIVILTGMYEVLLGLAFFTPHKRKIAAKISIAYLILTLPFNIYAAINEVNIKEANYTGEGVHYLWFRIPLQIFWIAWSYFIYRWVALPLKNSKKDSPLLNQKIS